MVQQLAIFGIPIAAIVVFIGQMWAVNIVAEAVEPEFQRVLDQLDENIVCPPEFNAGSYEVCLSGNGDVLVNGKVGDAAYISVGGLTSKKCPISAGTFDHQVICRIEDVKNQQNFGMELTSLSGISRSINSGSLLPQLKTGAFIKIATRDWRQLWLFVKYIPK